MRLPKNGHATELEHISQFLLENGAIQQLHPITQFHMQPYLVPIRVRFPEFSHCFRLTHISKRSILQWRHCHPCPLLFEDTLFLVEAYQSQESRRNIFSQHPTPWRQVPLLKSISNFSERRSTLSSGITFAIKTNRIEELGSCILTIL